MNNTVGLVSLMRTINALENKERNNVIKRSLKNIKRNELSNKAKILYNMILRKNIKSIQQELERREKILNKVKAAQKRLRNLSNVARYVVQPNGTINLGTARRNANRNKVKNEIKSLMNTL